MTAKFIPFDPKTAKNGDIVYGVLTGREYRYVGKHPINNDGVITYTVAEKHLGFELPENLKIKQPMKTVWINIVKYGLCGLESSVFDDEKMAKGMSSKYAGDYLGTFPIEIPA